MLTAALGFQPGMYATPQVPPPRGPRALIHFTASGHRVTGFAVGVLNAPCRGPITRRHKRGFIGGGGPFSAPIDTHGRFKIRINGARGGEVGTIKGRLEGSGATGTVSLTTHFFGVGILNPHGPSSCGVKKLRWAALRGL